MNIKVASDKAALGTMAARHAAESLRAAIAGRGRARIIAATGASQFDFLAALVKSPGIDWAKVEMFHLDEYAGLAPSHPASFRKYLRERLIEPAGVGAYHLLDGKNHGEIGARISKAPIDVAFVGIGENGHLAFNDPPADFDTEEPYIIVKLDEACRRQQVGEGWFGSIDDVPREAVSMSIRQIMKSSEIICIVPDARKAKAVQACFEGEIGPMTPASILRRHPNTTVYLDPDSAALLKTK